MSLASDFKEKTGKAYGSESYKILNRHMKELKRNGTILCHHQTEMDGTSKEALLFNDGSALLLSTYSDFTEIGDMHAETLLHLILHYHPFSDLETKQ